MTEGNIDVDEFRDWLRHGGHHEQGSAPGGFMVPEVMVRDVCGPVRHLFARLGLCQHETEEFPVMERIIEELSRASQRP